MPNQITLSKCIISAISNYHYDVITVGIVFYMLQKINPIFHSNGYLWMARIFSEMRRRSDLFTLLTHSTMENSLWEISKKSSTAPQNDPEATSRPVQNEATPFQEMPLLTPDGQLETMNDPNLIKQDQVFAETTCKTGQAAGNSGNTGTKKKIPAGNMASHRPQSTSQQNLPADEQAGAAGGFSGDNDDMQKRIAELTAHLAAVYTEKNALHAELHNCISVVSKTHERLEQTELRLLEMKKRYEEDVDEWQQFRQVLRNEAELAQQLQAEIDALREQIRALEAVEEPAEDAEVPIPDALLEWCQLRTMGYHHVDIQDFDASWRDGMAMCALLHSYMPGSVPYNSLSPAFRRRNFFIAFTAARNAGVTATLDMDSADARRIYAYIAALRAHFERPW